MSRPEAVGIRAADHEDIPAIRTVAQTAWDDTYRNTIPEDVRREFVGRSYSEATLHARLGSNVFLVATRGGTVVGFADLRPLQDKLADLAALYVLPEAQRRGIGARLLEEGIANFLPDTRFTLRVEWHNTPARHFYEAHGFRRSGAFIEDLLGHPVHEIEMVRPPEDRPAKPRPDGASPESSRH